MAYKEKFCRECGKMFRPTAPNQAFCCEWCREAHEERLTLLASFSGRPKRTEEDSLEDVKQAELQGYGTKYGHYMAHKAGVDMRKEERLTDAELFEIRQMCRHAKDRAEQFVILRDLYLVSEKTLLRVLGLDDAPKLHKHNNTVIPASKKEAAARDVFNKGMSVTQAAKLHGIGKTTLQVYVNKKMEEML